MNNTRMDDNYDIMRDPDEDMESREKPKVTYICGGNFT